MPTNLLFTIGSKRPVVWKNPLTFIEITPPRKEKAKTLSMSKPVQADQSDGVAVCHIRLKDYDMTVPSGYFAAHLAEILRAVRASK